MLHILLLISGFAGLIAGAEMLINGSTSLAKRFNVPNIVIGLTIVAFGTSAPELVVNIFGSVKGDSSIVLGNVLGSNILNILIILGLASLFYPLKVKSSTTWIEIPLSLLAAVLVLVVASDTYLDNAGSSVISRSEGITLLLFFLIFLAYNAQLIRNNDYEEEVPVKSYPFFKSVFLILFGLALLITGGHVIVGSAVVIPRNMGVSERVISLTVISLGTSLPELATSVMAARKRNVDLAIGNVVGSNIFNIFLILGLSATIHPVEVGPGVYFDILVNILTGVLLLMFVFLGKGRRIDRGEGIVFLLVYTAYLYILLHYH